MIVSLADHTPRLAPGAFVHEMACVIGQVELGSHGSVWPNATVRGDTDAITIGARTNIQDGAVIHADKGVPCTIGNDVTVGHLACVHGCTVEDEVLIGIGAIILNHARIGTGSIVGAGALVTEGTIIAPGSLVIGSPARMLRQTTDEQRASIQVSARHYASMIGVHGG